MQGECLVGETDEYGERYILDFQHERMEQETTIRTTWIVKSGEDFPGLKSCFIV